MKGKAVEAPKADLRLIIGPSAFHHTALRSLYVVYLCDSACLWSAAGGDGIEREKGRER